MDLLIAFLVLMVTHFFGDWVAQSHWMATNKSKSLGALGLHVGSYGIVLAAGLAAAGMFGLTIFAVPASVFLTFVFVNLALHFSIDYVTSRMTSALWAKQDWHNFFMVIGFDQLLHYMCLALTLVVLL